MLQKKKCVLCKQQGKPRVIINKTEYICSACMKKEREAMLADENHPAWQYYEAMNLALLASDEFRVGAFVWKPTGLIIDGEIRREDWEETGKLLKMLDSSMQWLIGDLIVHGESLRWGDQKTIAEAFGFEYGTVRVYASVCRNVEMLIRINSLDFAHHQLVASMPRSEQKRWLQAAAEGDDGKRWSVARLRDEIKAAQLGAGEEKQPLPKWLQPISQLRKAYNPKVWASMTKREKQRVHEELKGYLAYMEDNMVDED
jgi:hypothetical protein